MNLLFLMIKEYISIVEQLRSLYPLENGRLIVERESFKTILEKYAFASFAQKIKVYKDLNLIIYDNNNYTMPYKDKSLKKTVRKVIINYKTYETMLELYSVPTKK